MSDERIAEFRERARDGVGLPDLDGLVRRGVARRRRRRGAGVVALAAAAVGLVLLQVPGGDRRGDSHFVDHPSDAPAVGSNLLTDEETLAPGAPAHDEFVLSTGATVRLDLEAPADGWFAHLGGPQRGLNVGPESAWTGLLWYEATGVYAQRCGEVASASVVPLRDSLAPLTGMSYVRKVLQEPEAATLGGRAAQHAVIVVKGCGGEQEYPHPLATGGDTGPLPGGRPFDIWLVPLPEAETALVVFDPTGDGSAEVRGQWQQVVDSLEITVTAAG